MRLAILLSQVRLEEKLIFAAAERAGIELVKVFDKELILDIDHPSFPEVDLALDRGLVHSRLEYTLRFLDGMGIPTVNSYQATINCDNKFLTSMRLLAKINDRDAAEAVLEHKDLLGSYHHSIFYIQEYVPKRASELGPGHGDIRAFVVGDRVVGASYRSSEHWITNVARGATTTPCPVTDEIEDVALRAARAVGGEILGVDLVETEKGLKVIEINTGAEFKGLIEATGVDVPAAIVAYLQERVSVTGLMR